jgi:hypothetical protein
MLFNLSPLLLLLLPLLLPPCAPARSPPRLLYGLIRDRNSASCRGAPSGCTQLVSVGRETGTLRKIGGGHTPIAAVGDLRVVRRGVYYYLGDGLNGTGTVLVGLSVESGAQVCAQVVEGEIAELGEVGGAQSLVLDEARGELILSGIPNATGPHLLLRLKLKETHEEEEEEEEVVVVVEGEEKKRKKKKGGRATGVVAACGDVSVFGSFEYSGSLPMAHGTALDAAGQRLITTLSTGKESFAIGLVDVSATGPAPSAGSRLYKTYAMAGNHELWSPTLISPSVVAGPAENEGQLDWRSLRLPSSGGGSSNSSSNSTWSSTPLKFAIPQNASETFQTLWGNLGSVRAYDSGMLYVLLAQGRSEKLHLCGIDVQRGAVVSAALLNGDLGFSSEVLLQLAFA